MKLGNFAILTLNWGEIKLSKFKRFEYQIETRSHFTSQKFSCRFWKFNSNHKAKYFTFCIPRVIFIELNIHTAFPK